MSENIPAYDDMEMDVYPVHVLDNAKVNYCFVSFIMRFNDVLDPKMLRDSLTKLLEIGNWRKLGGRLRFKPDGKLEIHVPTSFSEDYPAFIYSRTDLYTTNIADHPVGSQFPEPTEHPSIQPILSEFRPFLARSEFPQTIHQMIQQDLPQLSLHITSFSDTTLVSITWPHTLMDITGIQALLKSWTLVMNSQEAEVPPILGAREDVLSEVEDDYDDEMKKQDFALDKHRLMGMGKVMFYLRFLWDKMWNSKPELRTMFIPKSTFARLQAQAKQEVEEYVKDSYTSLFISDGDIITAWATRAVALTDPRPRTVAAVGLLDGRARIPRLASAEGVYAQNIVLTTCAFVEPEITKGNIGPIALCHRRHLVEQTSEQQVRSWIRTIRPQIDANPGEMLLFGPPDSLPILFNNLIKANLMEAANFGVAVTRPGDQSEGRTNAPGTMIMNYNQPLTKPQGWPCCFYMLNKDVAGNYWLMGSLTPQAWANIEEDLAALES